VEAGKALETPQWSGSTEGLSRLRHEHVVLEWRLEQHPWLKRRGRGA
jgi:hypothetical protein